MNFFVLLIDGKVCVPAGGVVTLNGRLSTQPWLLHPLIQKL